MGALRAGFNGTVGQPSAQVIDSSLKFEGTSSHLKKTPASIGNRRTFTFSCWVKRSEIGSIYPAILSAGSASGDTGFFQITFEADEFSAYMRHSGGTNYYYTNAKLRDISSWYHLVVAMDTTQSAEADRLKMYINGVEPTYRNTSVPSPNQTFLVNNTSLHQIGATKNISSTTNNFLPGYLSNVYLIDGQALGPEYFGYTDGLTNTWRPKKFEGPTSPNDGTTWSSNLTVSGGTYTNVLNPEYAFDNDSYGTYADTSGTGNAVYTFSPPSTIRANSSVRVSAYAASGQDTNHIKITYNNGVEVTKTANDLGLGTPGDQAWFDLSSYINFPADISSIEYSSIGGGGRIAAIEIDGILLIDGFNDPKGFGTNGFYLPMDGNSPIGKDKSGIVTPNNGTTWSNHLTSSTGFRSAEPKTNAFDGNTSSICSASGSGTITFTSPVTFASNSTIRVFLHGGNHTVTVNGGDSQTISAGSFQKVTYSNPGNSTFVMTFYRGGNNDTGVRAIEINGVLLVDGQIGNNWTPVNFSGSNTIEKATGALPILNTVSGGNVATVGVRTDANASNLVLALPLVGNANDVSNRINSGSTTKVVTVTNAGASNVANFYGGSFYFDGAGDYLSIADSDDLDGFNDFTIEMWINGTNIEGNDVLITKGWNQSSYAPYLLHFGGDGSLVLYLSSDNSSWDILSGQGCSPAVFEGKGWHHFAISRSGSNIRCFTDGVETHSFTSSTQIASNNQPLYIGAAYNAGVPMQGYIQDVRIYKGVAKYTENFIPASTNPDILPDTPSGVSGGSKLTKITEGAVSIPGTTDYLVVSDSTDLELGGDDFTIEAYINPTGIPGSSGYNCIFAKGESLQCYFMSNGSLTLFASTNYTANNYDIINGNGAGAGSISLNKWTHLAVCRSAAVGPGDTWKVFVDGVEKYTGNHTGTIENNAHGFSIGDYAPSAGTYDYQGFISNFRVVKGTALYTSNFTPPTEPLTEVTNTKLLCCQSNTQPGAAVTSPNMGGVNDGTQWSHYIDGTAYGPTYSKSNMFDGVATAGTRTIPLSNTRMTWRPPTPISINTSLRLYCYCYNDVDSGLKINGVNYGSAVHTANGTTMDWYTVPGPPSTLTSLEWSTGNGGGENGAFSAIEVDGTILVDPLTPNGDVAATNFNPFNTDINTVRGQETGYPTWNPLRVSGQTLSNNNMTTTGTGGNVLGSMFTPTSGKFYWEVIAGSDYTMAGIQRENNYDMSNPGNSTGSIALYLNGAMGSGQLYKGGSITSSWGGGVTGDIIGVALDMDNNKVYFYNNGKGLGAGGITGTPEAVDVPIGGGYTANCRSGSGQYDGSSTINFGQTPFKFPPPDGFQPLNAANVRPETVIARPDRYVGVTTYTGNAPTGSTNTQSLNTGFKPDLVWIKSRDATRNHRLTDTVRGAGKELYSDLPNAEGTVTDGVISFTDNGFVVGANNNYNYTEGYVAWAWKAGGDKNTFNIDDVGYANASDVNMNVGGLNSTLYNSSQTWSTYGTQSGDQYTATAGTYVWADVFDNVSDNPQDVGYCVYGPNQKWTFTNPVSVSSSVALAVWGLGTLTLNAGETDEVTLRSGGEYYNTITDTSLAGATLKNIQLDVGTAIYLFSVHIDGARLVDPNIAPDTPSIAATGCSVGTKQGFSIIKYTGDAGSDTVSHGLTQPPDLLIVKQLNNAGTESWHVMHSALGATYRGYLNSTASFGNTDDGFGNVDPTSSVFTVAYNGTNKSESDYIAYCWHDVPGLQKFGSYVGNSNADGPYVELGFKPAVVWIKNSSNGGSSDNWACFDNVREGYNVDNDPLYLNKVNTEATTDMIDLLSNGFKIRATFNSINGTTNNVGDKMIYCAWAETPAINLYGGASNAR